jgi:hypothetical protein
MMFLYMMSRQMREAEIISAILVFDKDGIMDYAELVRLMLS